jgi:hypothetical protein
MYQGVTPAPDSAFVKDLKAFDPLLRVRFERRMERFVITKRRAFGDDFNVLVVQTEDGQFRQPDQRDIKHLYAGDLWRHGGVDARIRRGEEYMKNEQEKLDKEISEESLARTRDSKIQLSNTYRKTFNDGSKAPELRRIELNRKGLTIDEIRAARAVGRDPWNQEATAS